MCFLHISDVACDQSGPVFCQIKFSAMFFCATAQSCLHIPDNGGSQERSPFMVDHLHRSASASAVTSAQLTCIICTDGSILSHWVVFSFQGRAGIWGLLALWLSHPPPVLIPAHAMKQNTTDMSGRKALSGRQKHLPKYLHLLLLFIRHQRGDLLLVFGDHLFSWSPRAPGAGFGITATCSSCCNLRPR